MVLLFLGCRDFTPSKDSYDLALSQHFDGDEEKHEKFEV
jgi:hypothetical protein